MTTFWNALGLGLSLIMAVGPQNAFVIRQGLRRRHVWVAVLACCVADTVMMSVGVLGVGQAFASQPLLVLLGTLAGAAFLLWYGWQAFRSALKGHAPELAGDDGGSTPAQVVRSAMAFSFLNPHAFLDTVVLIGGASASTAPGERLPFLGGVITASWLWFGILGLASVAFAPLMRSARMWQLVDLLVALMMWTIAARLLLHLNV